MVHDEIILEVPEEHAVKWQKKLQHYMEKAGNDIMGKGIYMKADASIGSNWNEAK